MANLPRRRSALRGGGHLGHRSRGPVLRPAVRYHLPNGLDTDGKITVDYGVIGLPVTFFVDSSGIVRRRWVGAIDATTLDEWLNELIGGTVRQGDSEGENLERFFELEP